MASESKKPLKGILKASTSFDNAETELPSKEHLSKHRDSIKEMKWDEMNILATYHPADKDYGHKKIDEPPTPYNKLYEDMELDPEEIADRLKADTKKGWSSGSDDDDEHLTAEQIAHNKDFSSQRKKHYNEFQAVQLARKLMEEEEEDDDIAEGACSSTQPNGDEGDKS